MITRRKKKVEHKGVTVEVSFQCGNLNYSVQNGSDASNSSDLHEALGNANVAPRKTNFLIRGVKQVLGL